MEARVMDTGPSATSPRGYLRGGVHDGRRHEDLAHQTLRH